MRKSEQAAIVRLVRCMQQLQRRLTELGIENTN